MASQINYRKLLRKYMALVLDCEGTTFVSYAPNNRYLPEPFTPEEVEALYRLDEQVIDNVR